MQASSSAKVRRTWKASGRTEEMGAAHALALLRNQGYAETTEAAWVKLLTGPVETYECKYEVIL